MNCTDCAQSWPVYMANCPGCQKRALDHTTTKDERQRMTGKPPDFFRIEPHHMAMHLRCENWARYVSVKAPSWVSPMWRQGKSNGRQWSVPDIREPVNTLDGHAIEKAVGNLPELHRDAIRWFYVVRCSPNKARKALAVTEQALMLLVKDARTMLINRGA